MNKVKKKEIKNLENIIAEVHPFYVETIAEALYDAGYKKQIWHKVSDGDLPKFIKHDLIIAIKCNDGVIRTVTGNYRLERFNVSDLGEIEIEKVVAWAELPLYEEPLHEN